MNGTHTGARDAFLSVDKQSKRNAFIMLGAAGVTLAVGLLSRLIWLAEPVLDMIYHGTAAVVYYVVLGALFAGYAVGLNFFLKRVVGIRIFKTEKSDLTTKQSVISALCIIALGAAAVFVASAYNGFKLKLETEMGLGVTLETAIINVLVYIYYGLHLWLGFIAAELVQRAGNTLFPSKYGVPFGAIFLVTFFGLSQLAAEIFATSHMFPMLYYLFTYVYAAIYEITGRRYRLSYWASVAVMVL